MLVLDENLRALRIVRRRIHAIAVVDFPARPEG